MSEVIRLPDVGGDGEVIEIMVAVGDRVEAEQSILVLESDKASMEVPCPRAGTIKALKFKLGDRLKEGDELLELDVDAGEDSTAAAADSEPAPAAASEPAEKPTSASEPAPTQAQPEKPAPTALPTSAPAESARVHAGPAVRRLARELGVDLGRVEPSGPHQRILKEDVQGFVRSALQSPGAGGGAGIEPIPSIDFSRFGETEVREMTRLQQLGAANLHRSWLNVPHVTQFDQADITELEAFRLAEKTAADQAGVKLTLLPFLISACARLLQEMPEFNVSLLGDGKRLVQKKYVHIGFAVDTPDGLLVPVIRDAGHKGLLQLAAEAAELAEKARNKKLGSDAMQGACFTITSLGHIGGSGFTPIVNAPEVAILGVSRASHQPVWDGAAFQPRLMLPLSLSYDHRAINGAAAARFTRRLGELLGDVRRMLL